MTHIDELSVHISNFATKRILDLGSGKGGFLVNAAKRGLNVVGLETSATYIDETLSRAREASVHVEVVQGVGESLPFPNASFDVVNMAEVIEHVADPKQVLNEVHRVLVRGGFVYISVPARFSARDPHYHLWGINWIPRRISNNYAALFGKAKRDVQGAGAQTLEEMHYFTFRQIRKILASVGFSVTDIREKKISNKFKGMTRFLFLTLYRCIRPFYFDTFHLLLRKL